MDKIKKAASKVRTASDKKSENAVFGSKPVLTDKPLSAKTSNLILHDSEPVTSVGDSIMKLKTYEDINSDSDSIVSKNKAKRAEELAIQAFELEKCTTLVFIALNGDKSEKLLTKRILSYSDLQREIARLNPKRNKMCVIQDSQGKRITSEYFHNQGDTAIIRVKEIGFQPIDTLLKKLNIHWEVEEYHDIKTGQSVFDQMNAKDDFSDIMSVNSYQAGMDD